MNLKEFIDYRHNCPLCNSPLALSFHSKKWQSIRYEEDRLVILVRMNGFKKNQKDYKVAYSFGLDDNSWFVNFLTKEEKPIEQEIPSFLMNRFKEMNKNLSLYRFYKHCQNNCKRYSYSSNYFDLDFKSASIGEIEIIFEHFGLSKPNPSGGYRIYDLINKVNLGETIISYGVASHDNPEWAVSTQFQTLRIPLIKFSSKEETLERIQKLIVFS